MGKVDTKPNQNQRILDYIAEHGSISQLEALNALGIMRLASRISDLKRRGYPIISHMDSVKNRFGEECRIKRYRLAGEEDGKE